MKNSLTQKLKRSEGFTIIEVVLVLAIAGLIFLMVFIALPALQRSQADTQRRDDAGRFLSAITSYQTNSRGAVPATSGTGLSGFISSYLTTNGESFSDPSTGTQYNVTTNTPKAIGDMQYITNASCATSGTGVTTGTGTRKVAVVMALSNVDSGGSYAGTYCTSN